MPAPPQAPRSTLLPSPLLELKNHQLPPGILGQHTTRHRNSGPIKSNTIATALLVFKHHVKIVNIYLTKTIFRRPLHSSQREEEATP